ncbi:MAG: porin [Prevotella sp.]|uniref:porin n=1 Tax=Prevotella sp. TaxID=59823 RepID=UPI002A2F491E|nr:porin [Prevotella sp.]MDD7318259.1 porin [Prevotellaceae bacterium]MDY4019737.1 porin [Prevotella sp.]
MRKPFLTFVLLLTSILAVSAQENKKLFSPIKFSGYFIGYYRYNGQKDNVSNGFDFRLLRMTASGKILEDFEWKIQAQVTGNTETLSKSPRMVDMSLEWQRFPEFRVKLGQYKIPFTIENPEHPLDIGFMDNAQVIGKLSNFSDRTGIHSSNGRDVGLQIQGDLFPNADGHRLFHYQVGVFNGQGINTPDVGNQKDIIGGVWVSPIPGLRIGTFGWTGSYARKNGSQFAKVDRRRYAFSAEYDRDDWTFRSEYVHSTGGKFKTAVNKDGSSSDLTIDEEAGTKADGFYVMASAPIVKNKAHIRARYDLYRDRADMASSKTMYEIEANYMFTKNIILSLEYAFVNDRNIPNPDNHNYSIVEARMGVRF